MGADPFNYKLIENHPKLVSIRHKVSHNQAIATWTLKTMITEAIDSNPRTKGRATDANIAWVAEKLGISYQPQVKPGPVVAQVAKVQGVAKTEAQLVTWVKSKLPANAHGDISGCVNDVLLDRNGKSCKDVTGKDYGKLRHCSAGKTGAAGGCTLFYLPGADGMPNVIAVGQHNTNHKVSYTILEKGNSGLPNELILKK